MTFKPSRGATAIGFPNPQPRYIEHPRSRWYGNPYWLVADNPKAIPASVREKGERAPMSPKKITNCVARSAAAKDSGYALGVRAWTIPVKVVTQFLQAPKIDGLYSGSLLATAVNPHFLAWVDRHTVEGDWWIDPRGGPLFKTAKRDLIAVLMPVRTWDVLRLHSVSVAA